MLDDKAVVITGAGRGLGRAYAIDAVSAGASVILNDRDLEPLEEVAAELGGTSDRMVLAPGSVADWDFARSLVDGCVERFGRIDGFVNNAGVHHCEWIWAEHEADIRRTVEVNVTGTMFCAVHALRAMRDQGFGSLVNVTSGAHLGMPEMSTYGATKGAVASATYGWAVDCQGSGVRVNAISPVALTRMTSNWKAPGAELTLSSSPPPETIAPLVTFLLSDASREMTGQVIRLDKDGLSIMQPATYPSEVVPLPERTATAVARAFADGLGEKLAPVGLGRWVTDDEADQASAK
jgi:NAD(P)-dependent dehydrogenase (short-subunit alcohol dehydrogenase family)